MTPPARDLATFGLRHQRRDQLDHRLPKINEQDKNVRYMPNGNNTSADTS